MGGRDRRNLDTQTECKARSWGLCWGKDARGGRSLSSKYGFLCLELLLPVLEGAVRACWKGCGPWLWVVI